MAVEAVSGLAASTVRQQIAAAFMQTLSRETLLAGMASRTHESTVRSGQVAHIPRDKTQYAVSDVAASGSPSSMVYPTGTDMDVDDVDFWWQRTIKPTPKRLTELQESALTPNMRVQMVDQMADKEAVHIDTYIAEQLRGESLSAVVQDFSNASQTANQNSLAGSTTNYLQSDGSFAGVTAPSDIAYKAIKAALFNMRTANKIRRGSRMVSASAIAMGEQVYEQIDNYIATLDADELVVAGVDGAERDMLFGYPLIVSNALDKYKVQDDTTNAAFGDYVTTGGKDAYPVYLVNTQWLAYADMMYPPTIVTPEQNQDGRYWQINMMGHFAFKVIDNRYLYRIGIRAEA